MNEFETIETLVNELARVHEKLNVAENLIEQQQEFLNSEIIDGLADDIRGILNCSDSMNRIIDDATDLEEIKEEISTELEELSDCVESVKDGISELNDNNKSLKEYDFEGDRDFQSYLEEIFPEYIFKCDGGKWFVVSKI